uniref:Uncharacterized protein n=1 Tax=Oryza sativa subsp. japonica TaxID=39947 RepID=Q10DD4_ORYSJ|nr:hypothetical protein LOC_Os03g52258 [Oryza sativa Japonica Group]
MASIGFSKRWGKGKDARSTCSYRDGKNINKYTPRPKTDKNKRCRGGKQQREQQNV